MRTTKYIVNVVKNHKDVTPEVFTHDRCTKLPRQNRGSVLSVLEATELHTHSHARTHTHTHTRRTVPNNIIETIGRFR